MRAGADDRPDVFAPQCGGESTRDKPVDELHTLEVARGRHDVEKRAVDGQRALLLGEVGGTRLTDQLCALAAGVIGVGVVDSIHVFDDRETGCTQRIGDEERTHVSPVNRDAWAWELVVVVGRKGAADDRAAAER